MVSTINPTETTETTEFSFPLRITESSSSSIATGSADCTKFKKPISHSRQYTGIELPLGIIQTSSSQSKRTLFSHENLSAPSLTPQQTPTSPTTHGGMTTTIAATNFGQFSKSPHRRHAHKRSGAVSMHDIKVDLAPKFVPSIPGAASSLQSPALTFASSTSTFTSTNSSTVSLPTEVYPSLPSPKPPSQRQHSGAKVSFAPVNTQSSPNMNSATTSTSPKKVIEQQSSPPPLMPLPLSLSLPKKDDEAKPKSRHKKVKSWAGSFIKFRSKKNDVKLSKSVESMSPTHFQSSSYIPMITVDGDEYYDSGDEPEPLIDLDSALYGFGNAIGDENEEFSSNNYFLNSPFRVQHRRSESAPATAAPERNFLRGMKNRMVPLIEESRSESILEEEEDEKEEGEEGEEGGEEEDEYEDHDDEVDEVEEKNHFLMEPGAASSNVSLASTTSLGINRDRGRYSRNYDDSLFALGLVKSQPSPIKSKPKSKSKSPVPLPTSFNKPDPSTLVADLNIASNRSTISDQQRWSVAISSSGTITPPNCNPDMAVEVPGSPVTIRSRDDDDDYSSSRFALGEPGPQVQQPIFDDTASQQSVTIKRRSIFSIKNFQNRSSIISTSRDSTFSASSKRSVAKRMWGWVKHRLD